MATRGIEAAAADGSLLHREDLARLLYGWRDLKADDGVSVQQWTAARLADDVAVARLARALTSHGWGQGMSFNGTGDLVAKRSDLAAVDTIHTLLDRDQFRARLEATPGAHPWRPG